MATIRYYLKGKSNPTRIYVRFSISNDKDFRRITPELIKRENWDSKKQFPKTIINPKGEAKKTLQRSLDKVALKLNKFEIELLENYSDAIKEGDVIDSQWLKNQIDNYFNQSSKGDEVDYTILDNYADYFLKQKTKQYDKGQLSLGSLKKYKVIVKRLKAFQQHKKKSLRLKDVNLDTIEQLEDYLLKTHKLSVNTTGRFIKFVKQIALHARDNKNLRVSKDLIRIKGYTVEAEKIYLSFNELEGINKTEFDKPHLDNARDWLIIGCYTGQRVSDLLRFRKHHIIETKGTKLIQIKQVKTNKDVSIPIHPKVQNILNKYGQDFPRPLSDQKFNKYIKTVCEKANIKEMTQGSKFDKKTKRKKSGVYEKWELVTSHICRRSFATNFYGKIPTSLLISITAHSTEKQYLEYVGKPEQQKSLEVAKLWQSEQTDPAPEPTNKPKHLKIV